MNTEQIFESEYA